MKTSHLILLIISISLWSCGTSMAQGLELHSSLLKEYQQAVQADLQAAKSAEIQMEIQACWRVLYQPYDLEEIESAEKRLKTIDQSCLTETQKEECMQLRYAMSMYRKDVTPFIQKFSNMENGVKEQLAKVLDPVRNSDNYTVAYVCNNSLKNWFESAAFDTYSNNQVPYLRELAKDLEQRYKKLCDSKTASTVALRDFLDCEYRIDVRYIKNGVEPIKVDFPQDQSSVTFSQNHAEQLLCHLPPIKSIEEGNLRTNDLREILSIVNQSNNEIPSYFEATQKTVVQWMAIEKAQSVLAQAYDSTAIVSARKDLKEVKTEPYFQDQALVHELDSLDRSLAYYGRKFQYDRLLQIVDMLYETIGPDSISKIENSETADSLYKEIIKSPAQLSVVNRADYTHKKWVELVELNPLDKDGHFCPTKKYWQGVANIRKELIDVLGESSEE